MEFKESLYRFKSGISLILVNSPNYYTARVELRFRVGAEDEETPRGIAHLVEHELFKGTNKYNQEELSIMFNKLSVDVDASTSSEFTNFVAKFPKRNIEPVVELLSNMIFDSAFEKNELEKEKSVILQEISMYEDIPDRLVFDKLVEGLYKDVGIGNEIAGKSELLKAVKREDLIEFHKTHYNAKNLIVSVCGDFKMEEIKPLIEKHFDARFKEKTGIKEKEWSKQSKVLPKTIKTIKPTVQSNVIMAIKTRPYSGFENIKFNIINYILGGSMSSRLFLKIRNECGLCYEIYSGKILYKNNGFFYVAFATSPEAVKQAINSIKNEISEILKNGVSDSEFNEAKSMMIDKYYMSKDRPTSSLSHFSYFDELLDREEYERYLNSLKKEDCLNYFRENIDLNNLVISYVGKDIDL